LAEVLLRYDNRNASYTFCCLCTKFLSMSSVSKCSCITAVTCNAASVYSKPERMFSKVDFDTVRSTMSEDRLEALVGAGSQKVSH